jgi:hypothetical protein
MVTPEAADLVASGDMMLNEAYAKATEVQKQYASEPEQRKRLKEADPDLFERVESGKVSLAEAMTLYYAKQSVPARRKAP